MSLVWHMVWSDLRRLGLSLALWLVVIAAKLGLGVWLVWGPINDEDEFRSVITAGNWLVGIEVAMGYVLVARLLQSDALIGSTAFWMTRPISGARLFAVKLFGLAVIFGLMPVLVTLPWWLGCGYGGHEVLLATGETLLWQFIVVAAALPLAALTDEFSRFLLWSLVVGAGLLILNLIIFVGPKGGFGLSFSADAEIVLGLIGSVVLVLGGCVAAVHQFFRRRTGWSIGLGAAAIVAGLLVIVNPGIARAIRPLVVHIHDRQMARELPTTRAAPEMPLQLSYLWARPSGPYPGHNEEWLSVGIRVEGMPADSFIELGGGEEQWNWPAGITLKRKVSIGFHSRSPRAWRNAIGLTPPVPPPGYFEYLRAQKSKRGWRGEYLGDPQRYSNDEGTVSAPVPVSLAARTRRDPPAYSLRADFLVVRAELVGEKIPRVAETLGRGSNSVRIGGMSDMYLFKRKDGRASWYSSKPEIDPTTGTRPSYHQSRAIFAVHRRPALCSQIGWFSGVGAELTFPERDAVYFLINRARGNASTGGGTWHTGAARIGTVAISWQDLSFVAVQDWKENKWEDQPGWWDEPLTLARVETHEEGWVSRELRVENFKVQETETTGGEP
jgi:hypothetical protein